MCCRYTLPSYHPLVIGAEQYLLQVTLPSYHPVVIGAEQYVLQVYVTLLLPLSTPYLLTTPYSKSVELTLTLTLTLPLPLPLTLTLTLPLTHVERGRLRDGGGFLARRRSLPAARYRTP